MYKPTFKHAIRLANDTAPNVSSLQASIVAPAYEESSKDVLLDSMNSSDVVSSLSNIRESNKIQKDQPRQIEPSKQAKKDVEKEELPGLGPKLAYSNAGAEDGALAFSYQGLRMVPTATFGY